MENNQNLVHLVGKLTSVRRVWTASEHTVYEGSLEVPRDSGALDTIPVLFNDLGIPDLNTYVSIEGQFRSRDITKDDGKLKVELYVYVKRITCLNEASVDSYTNDIVLDGYICKKPSLRTTPSGKQIADLLIACNYNKDKTAYIPVITWGRVARKSGKYTVGTFVTVTGRVQSRKYTKEVDGILKEFIAYEVSAVDIDVI